MSGYANSENTRQALIMAAGELFSEHGINAVTTRAIADKAGENIGVIHYHFGGKEGLLEAVTDYACAVWQRDPLGTFLEEHRYLMQSRNGQNTVIAALIEIMLTQMFSPDYPPWCCTLVFQLIQRDMAVSRRAFSATAKQTLGVFMEVYRLITGDDDFEHGYNWGMAIIAPAVMHAVNPMAMERLHPDGKPSDRFLEKLRQSCTQNALASIQFLMRLKSVTKRKTAVPEKRP